MEEKPDVPMLVRPRLVRRRTADTRIMSYELSKLESQVNSHEILTAAAVTPPPYQPENEVGDEMLELEIKQRLAALRGPGDDDDHIDACKPECVRTASNSNISSNEILGGGSNALDLDDTLLDRSSDQSQLNPIETEFNSNRNFRHNKVVQEQEMILKIIQEENHKKQIQEEATMKLIAELMKAEGGDSPSSLLHDNRVIANVGIQLNGSRSNKYKLGKSSDVQPSISGRRSETVANIIPTNAKVNLQNGVCDGAPPTLERQSHSSFEHERVRVANELKRRIEAQEREFLALQKEKSNEAEWQRVPKKRHHRAQKSRTSNNAW